MTNRISCNRRKLERVFVDPEAGWIPFERRQEIQRKKKPGSPMMQDYCTPENDNSIRPITRNSRERPSNPL